MNFSENLKQLREMNGLSLMKLARIIEVSDASIYNWENGKDPKISYLIKLANYFGVTTDELLGRESSDEHRQTGLGITPLENKLLQAFRKLSEDDQNKAVGILQALAVMS